MNQEKNYAALKSRQDAVKLIRFPKLQRRSKVAIFGSVFALISLLNFYDRLEYDQGKTMARQFPITFLKISKELRKSCYQKYRPVFDSFYAVKSFFSADGNLMKEYDLSEWTAK